MALTKMWLRVLCALGLVVALGCAGDDDDSGVLADPIGGGGLGGLGAAGGIAGGSGFVAPPPAGMSGGAAGISVPRAGAGAGGGAGMTGGAGAGAGGGAGMTTGGAGAGAGGMAGAAGAGAGGMAGTMAGSGGSSGPSMIREADPTDASTKGNGEYDFDTYTTGLRAPEQYGGHTVYYPTSAEAKPPFGVVAVVPGFTAYQSSIAQWGPFLASHGIVAITIDTITTADPPAQRALGLMDALENMKAENMRAGSPLMGKINVDALGVSGWSMGGGGTLIAASNNPSLKAAVSFAAWGPTGGAKNTVPALMFEATADILAASMSDGFYSQTPDTTPKMLFEVSGSSHNVANSPRNHDGIIGQYGLSWFKVFLEGDERYRKFLTAAKPSITTSKFATNVK